jgi:hypothetical protein
VEKTTQSGQSQAPEIPAHEDFASETALSYSISEIVFA